MKAAAAVALCLGLVTLLALLRRRELSQGTGLLRVLLPSWRFFERPDQQFTLEVRIRAAHGAEGPFTPALPPCARDLRSLWFSPEHNLRLACHDLVERWVLELAERADVDVEAVEDMTSYRLVKHAVCYLHPALTPEDAERTYQLRLSSLSDSGAREVLFLSPYYRWD